MNDGTAPEPVARVTEVVDQDDEFALFDAPDTATERPGLL